MNQGETIAALRAELATVRESERRHRELIDSSHDVVWSADATGRLTFLSAAVRAFYGYDPQDLIGTPFSELVAPPDRERAIAAFASAVQSGSDELDFESEVLRQDGSKVTMITNVRLLRDGGGAITGVAGISRDMTGIQRAAGELKRQAQEQRELAAQLELQSIRLREAQALASVGSWEVDIVNGALHWSDETYRIFEMAKGPAGVSYATFLECVHPDDRAAVDAAYLESVANKTPYAVDHRLLMPDGRVKVVHERGQTFYHEGGGPLRSIGTCQDVTENRLTRNALYDSREALRGILDTVPQRVFWKDRDSVYLGCNHAFAQDMGFQTVDDVVGKTDYDAVWKENADLYRSDDRAVVESGQARLNYEEPIFFSDGQKRWLCTSKMPLRGRDGSVTSLIGTYEDVTERKRLEQQFHHAKRLESIGTLAAGIAHEINNPLTSVMANIEVARDWLEEGIAQLRGALEGPSNLRIRERVLDRLIELKELLGDATEGADRVRRLVLDVKNMARAEKTTGEALDLRKVVETATKMTAHQVRHAAAVRTRFEATPPVQGAEGSLVQVVTNLLLNAADAIGEGRADSNEIVVTTFTDAAGWACVEVRDTGPGIAPNVLSRIFDPFFTTKRFGAGMGLGLSTSHNIVAAGGGRLVVESPRGGGAVFRAFFPPSTSAAVVAPSAPEKPPETAAPMRAKVLVIDDETAVTVTLERILRAHHDVTIRTDAQEALDLIAAGSSFDLVLCDLMMPNLSGIDVHRVLMATHPAQAAKIVFMTGGAFTAAAQEFLATTKGVHITKPFTPATIRAMAASAVAAR